MSSISDPHLRWAFFAGCAALALVAAIAVLVASLRLRLRREEAAWLRWVAHWRPLLLEVMLSTRDPADLPHLKRRDQGRFLRLWTYLNESVRGEATVRLAAAADALGQRIALRRWLASPRRANRLQALLAAAHLHEPGAWPLLLRTARGSDATLSVLAARAMARIDGARATEVLLPLVLTRRDWDLVRVASFLAEAGDHFRPQLIALLPTVAPAQLPRALDLLAAMQAQLPAASIVRLLQPDQSPAAVCAALPLAGHDALEAVRSCAGHPRSKVRYQAARALCRLGDAQDSRLLLALLADPYWQVRMAAARTLVDLGLLQDPALRGLLAPGNPAQALVRHALAEKARARTGFEPQPPRRTASSTPLAASDAIGHGVEVLR